MICGFIKKLLMLYSIANAANKIEYDIKLANSGHKILKNNAKEKNIKQINVPYIYDGSNGHDCSQIDLFLSFDCQFCKQALEDLIKYLETKPKIKAKIYFYIQYQEDSEKILYLLATGQNLAQILELAKIFLYARASNFMNDKKFIAFLRKYPEIQENYMKNKAIYSVYRAKIQKKFFQMHVDKTPTWIINDKIYIEGMIGKLSDDVIEAFGKLEQVD